MISDREDRILEACLAELLGGETPPDLSEQILGKLATSAPANGSTEPNTRAPLMPVPVWDATREIAPPSAAATSASRPATGRARSRVLWGRPVWLSAAVAASLLLIVAAYSAFRGSRPQAERPEIVQSPQATPPQEEPAGKSVDIVNDRQQPAPVSEQGLAASPATAVPNIDEPKMRSAPSEAISRQDPPQAPAEPKAPDATPAPEPRRQTLVASSRSDEEIIADINAAIRRRWREEDVKPAALASDAEWCRRVYLDIIGRIPTYEETNRYLADRRPNKKSRLVDRLLDSDECLEEYARNWTNIWTALLVGRSGGQEPDSLVNREGLQQYLRRSFLKNKPYDQFVAELVSAEGSNTPGTPDFNGAVNFVLDNLQENGVPATAKTARIFLGMQVQCTQCHNHPFNDWKQDQFWELNGFFRQARSVTERQGNRVVSAKLVDRDFAGDGGDSLDEAEVYWEMRNGLVKVSYPAFVDGTRIDPSGAVERVNRRDELARLIQRSEQMPRALVNRLWGHFLGYGFTRTVDDLGPHNPPSHPELLDQLARDFAARDFDLTSLMRWIVLSEPYGLSSRIPAKTKDDPVAGEPPLFSYFYLRQMRAEELYESLLVATGAHATRGSYEEQERLKSQWLQQFTTAFATDENDECSTFNGTIAQTLMMWNGELVKQATKGEKGSFLHAVAAGESKNTAKISQLFTAALSRKPTNNELQVAQQLWQARQGDTTAALQDIWWAVLNSNEFILNH